MSCSEEVSTFFIAAHRVFPLFDVGGYGCDTARDDDKCGSDGADKREVLFLGVKRCAKMRSQ